MGLATRVTPTMMMMMMTQTDTRGTGLCAGLITRGCTRGSAWWMGPVLVMRLAMWTTATAWMVTWPASKGTRGWMRLFLRSSNRGSDRWMWMSPVGIFLVWLVTSYGRRGHGGWRMRMSLWCSMAGFGWCRPLRMGSRRNIDTRMRVAPRWDSAANTTRSIRVFPGW